MLRSRQKTNLSLTAQSSLWPSTGWHQVLLYFWNIGDRTSFVGDCDIAQPNRQETGSVCHNGYTYLIGCRKHHLLLQASSCGCNFSRACRFALESGDCHGVTQIKVRAGEVTCQILFVGPFIERLGQTKLWNVFPSLKIIAELQERDTDSHAPAQRSVLQPCRQSRPA